MKREVNIYQFKQRTPYSFMDYEFAQENNFSINDYRIIFRCIRDISENDFEALEQIFTEFNIKRPIDFRGHSLSTSDIVELDDKKYYCDSFGWKEI